MQKGLTLQQLASKIDGNQQLKRDFIADTTNLSMLVRPPQANEKASVELDIQDQATGFPLRPLAHDQINDRLGIGSKYYRRMLSEAPHLLARNVNHWFEANPQRRMIRTLGGDVRAFLSNKYRRIDNEQIARAALEVLAELPLVQIVSSEITEHRLHLQFTLPTIAGEVKVGDVVQAGGAISNSEVGLGSMSVSALLWRLRCLNGMKTAETLRRNHVGRLVEDEGEMEWSQDTIAADDKALLLKVRDMVRAAVDETKFRVRLSRARDLVGMPPIANVAQAIEVLANKVPLVGTEKDDILMSLINGGDLSAWGLLNAVTNQAHRAKDYDRAVEFEEMGGALFELPRDQWREILEATA